MILLELKSGNASMEIGSMDNYWSPYPALQAVPVIITAKFSSNVWLKHISIVTKSNLYRN